MRLEHRKLFEELLAIAKAISWARPPELSEHRMDELEDLIFHIETLLKDTENEEQS